MPILAFTLKYHKISILILPNVQKQTPSYKIRASSFHLNANKLVSSRQSKILEPPLLCGLDIVKKKKIKNQVPQKSTAGDFDLNGIFESHPNGMKQDLTLLSIRKAFLIPKLSVINFYACLLRFGTKKQLRSIS